MRSVLSRMPSNKLLEPRSDSPLGLVLSGGGARGAFQVGVWKVLREEGLGGDPDVVSGTSAGALNGALIAAGLSPEEMLEFWLGLAHAPPVKANERFFRSLDHALSRAAMREPFRSIGRRARELRVGARILKKHGFVGAPRRAMAVEYLLTARFDMVSDILDQIATSFLFDTSEMRDHLRKAIGGYSMRPRRVKLAINTVDSRTGGVVRIVSHAPTKRPDASATHYRVHEEITVDMILASASIPLLFNAVQVGDELLWDGGLLVNTPVAPAVALGARRIVPVLVTAGGKDAPLGLPTFGSAVERLADAFLENAYNTDRKLLLLRNEIAELRKEEGLFVVDLFRAVRPESSRTFNAGSYLFFEKEPMMRMYEAGMTAARDWLAEGPRRDSRELDG